VSSSTSRAELPHGVASFDPGPDRIILWTRVEGATEVTWHLAERSTDGEPLGELRTGTAAADERGCVHVEVDGLKAGTDHLYWFTAGGQRSPTGRTRTLPDGSPDRWRVALVCCADRSINELTVYQAVAEADVDLVVHLGDYIYETKGKGQHRHEPDHVCVTLEDYDRRYAQIRRDPALLALHARHPMVAIWDDHDIADNAWRHGAKAHDPDEHGPWPERLRAAALARQRWLPARLADPQDPLRLWRSVRAGDLAEVVVMDTRIDGRDQQAGDPGAPPLDDPDRALVGPAQRRWLEERIRDRSATWCVLATQVTMSPMQLPVPVGTRTLLDGAPSGYGIVDGRAVCVDEWDGYPAERRRVARWLADRGGDALVVSGDVHSSWVFDGTMASGIPAAAPEFVAPSVSSTPMGRQLPRGWRALARVAATAAEGARWYDLESFGFTVLDIGRRTIVGTWHAVDATSTDPTTEVIARWELGRDGPGSLRPIGGPKDPLRGAEPSDRIRSIASAALVVAACCAGGLAVAHARRRGAPALRAARRRSALRRGFRRIS
jgi:alkaline phosphatase D